MGKVLGGGSSINVMAWSRGHKSDWDFFASESGDPAWSYESVSTLYRRIEDWHGAQIRITAARRNGAMFNPQPSLTHAPAMLEGARRWDSNFRHQWPHDGGEGGCAIVDVRVRDGNDSRSFVPICIPAWSRPNLTVLTHALVGASNIRAPARDGVDCSTEGKTHRSVPRVKSCCHWARSTRRRC